MGLPKLYVWDDAIFVLATTLSEARSIASDRMKHLPVLASVVQHEEPCVLAAPAVHVVFHRSLASQVSA